MRDFAIVSAFEMDFRQGLTVFTGETGAGKSLLADALGQVLGGRADSTLVRAGAKRATITATFDISALPALRALLADADLSNQEHDEHKRCELSRELTASGRSRAAINGRHVTIGMLRELGASLVAIHAQNAHHSLNSSTQQRTIIDAYGGLEDALDTVAHTYRAFSDAHRAWQALISQNSGDVAARCELLTLHIEELTKFAPQPQELQALESEAHRLRHSFDLAEGTAEILNLLTSDAGAAAILAQSLRRLTTLNDYAPDLAPIATLLANATIHIDEACADLQTFADLLSTDPARIATVEARLSRCFELARKHHTDPAQLPALLTSMEDELARLEHQAEHTVALKARSNLALAAYHAAALKLSTARQTSAKQLTATVTRGLARLGMPGVNFAIDVSPVNNVPPRPEGLDQVMFTASTNPGQPHKALAKIASGGELARISLAIALAMQAQGRATTAPTLVFDEVDVGIGGRIAEVVGQELKHLGLDRQVLCITHLAQVAALGHHHFAVRKTATGNRIQVEIAALEKDRRIQEIARMLGGKRITAKTRAHAEELLYEG